MMQSQILMRTAWLPLVLVLAAATGAAAGTDPVRAPDEEVDSPGLRARQGLVPNEHLLFNGWGVTPAGQHEGKGKCQSSLLTQRHYRNWKCYACSTVITPRARVSIVRGLTLARFS